jgi:glycosyltransferase involved in cell wall biosynthesis
MAAIALNARFYSHLPTGMQRYGLEMAKRLAEELFIVRPNRPLRGTEGHAWEQFYLPLATRGRLLWSPNNTGPLGVSRQVCTIHDIIPIDRPDWFSPRFSAWYNWLLPKLVHRVQHLIAVSEFTKQRLVERLGVAPSKITVVWNGVDAQFTPRPLDEIDRMRRELGISSRQYLLSVGSLEPRKNLRALLTAWRRISPDLPADIDLVVVGAKGASLVFSDAKLGDVPPRVCLTGYVAQEQLPALYSGAMALVYPSLYEGFGLPPLEAMACGTPVVTSGTTSLPEVVGDSAVLVDPLSPDSIAEGIQRIVLDAPLRAQLRERGLRRARGITWDQSAAETRKVFSALL